MAKKWHSKSAEETLSELNFNCKGLTTLKAQECLIQYGPNELKKKKGKSPLKLLLGQFTDKLLEKCLNL
jgi:Ca2+-transporting ATPase